MREALNRILVDTTGQEYKKIAGDTDRDYIMNAAQAKEYGIIDEVIEKRS
jgi:ATP-dependent Clp protease protease subunit